MIRYAYLWKREADRGQQEGMKDRPCAIVLNVRRTGSRNRVVVLPITHTKPRLCDEAIELPDQTKRRLGLDGERSWVVVSEANIFAWPGPDLRPVVGNRAEGRAKTIAYGFLPPTLFRAIRDMVISRYRLKQLGLVPRPE